MRVELPSAFGPVRRLVTAVTTLSLLLAGAGVANADTTAAQQRVSYLGLTLTVPADWPVIDLAGQPGTCVRFDQHAVYLGTPDAQQNCPSDLIGRTESILVQPADATALTSADNATSHQITATAPGASITATYAGDRAQVEDILTGAGLPAATPRAATTAPKSAHAAPGVTPNVTALPTSVTNGTGEGFDACSAPSSAQLSGWAGSYTNIGIYIGGSNVACPQTNLTASWVSAEAAAGWHFLPMYVGPQAAGGGLTDPAGQGVAAADDAITQAAALGFGPGNVVYYDMENYTASYSAAALSFEAAWSSELHKAGYWAGIYGSNNSAIDDLAANYGGSATPDVIFDGKWDGTDDTTLPVLPSADWADHQRAHQYEGGIDETHGGYEINIDRDVLDVGVAGAAATPVTSDYVPTGPTRLLDTRTTGTALGAKGMDTLQITGTAGVPINATAVVLNVTATNPSGGGYLTVYPDGAARPASSNVNFNAGQTIPNLVTVPITDGKVDIFNFQYSVDVIADLFGYYTAGAGDAYTPTGPTRLFDTRANGATLGANSVYTLTVGGVSGVPADVSAVVLNVTASNPSLGGYLTVYPDGQTYPGGSDRPTASNLNFAAGQTIPNLVIVPVVDGKVNFYNFQGSVDVIADLFGYYTPGTGDSFTPAGPTRLLDTRTNHTTLGAGGYDTLQVAGIAGVPANVTAVALNVTVTNASLGSYLSVFPYSANPAKPTSSNLNFGAGQTIANLVIVPVSGGKVDFYNFQGSVDVIADLFGYFTS
ncbi:MAG TPA: DUF1906 domain-containing protein [Pseudonocardiaceae bacterium]|nr:DUF1906 domain-containing protein [Pseudonocardiaceae bacterium]